MNAVDPHEAGQRQAVPPRRRSRGGLVVVALLLVAAALAAFGILSRRTAVAGLQRRADGASIVPVSVISPLSGPPRRSVMLPGNLNAWYEAPIYAQVSGYVRMWYKDYGATVRKGELLATIDSPTVDAQYAAAQAELRVAQAREKLAVVTAKRWQALAGTQAVSQQEVDQQTANAAVTQAQVEAARQQVARYGALVAFERVVAPFDGVVTARRTDVGDDVNAAGGDVGSRGAASELFSVADIHALRLFVSVPQDFIDILKPGLTAALSLPQAPERRTPAQFLTSANAVNPQTRTVVTELTVPNPQHSLWPGTYANVHFSVPTNPDILILPEQALLFRSQGMQVALLGAHDRVHLQDVTLGLNLGNTVQVIAGLNKDDRVINNPSLGLLEGEQVRVVTPVHGYAPPSVAAPPEPAPPKRSPTGPSPTGPSSSRSGPSGPGAGGDPETDPQR